MDTVSFYNWDDLPQKNMTAHIKSRLISGEKVMLAQVTLAEGAVVAEHRHPHEQMSYVLSGRLEYNIYGEKRIVGSGEVVYLPSNISHAAVALVETVVLDVFSPPREDFLSGDKVDYMK